VQQYVLNVDCELFVDAFNCMLSEIYGIIFQHLFFILQACRPFVSFSCVGHFFSDRRVADGLVVSFSMKYYWSKNS
jgi:hypothetical protein